MGLGGGSFGSSAAAAEKQRQMKIAAGTQGVNDQFAGFNPQFYQQRAQDYYNFAQPQLGQQFQQTKQAVLGNLANRGLSNSSTRNQQVGGLNRELANQRQGLYDTGQQQAQSLQQQVEQSRGNALNLLYQSADPGAATGQAQRAAAGFSVPSAFAPVGNLFSNLANMYYTKQLINNGNRSTSTGSSLSVNPGALP